MQSQSVSDPLLSISADDGEALQALVLALGSGGAGAVLASSVSAWLSQPRRADVTLTVTAQDGRHLELDARRVRDPAVLLREVERLLRTEDSEQ